MDFPTTDRRISMRDIAKQLGVSHAAVSMALRDKGHVSERLRTEIKETARLLGYRPDPMLSSLVRYRQGKAIKTIQGCVAWLNAWEEPDALRDHKEFDAYWNGANQAAESLGYRLEEFKLGRGCDPERVHRILSARGIHGILLPPHRNEPDWGDFPWHEYFVVRFGRSLRTPASHIVTADQTGNTTLAFGKMLDHGYRRIGFVTNEVPEKVRGHLFEAGYLIAQRGLPESRRLPVFSLLGLGPKRAGHAFSEWLEENRPDAILTDYPGLPGMLAAAGLRMPEDIAVASTTVLDTPVTAGIDQHPEEIGRLGALLLGSLISDGTRGANTVFRKILVDGSWVEGDTLPVKPAPAMPRRVKRAAVS